MTTESSPSGGIRTASYVMLRLVASHEIRLSPSNDPLDSAVRYKPRIAATHAAPVHAGRPARLTVCGLPSDPDASQPFDSAMAGACQRCVERIAQIRRRPSRVVKSQAGASV